MTKFQDKFASLRQVNSPYGWNNFQICCTDMYLIRFLPNFAVFFVFLWISRLRDRAKYQKPCQISDKNSIREWLQRDLRRNFKRAIKIIYFPRSVSACNFCTEIKLFVCAFFHVFSLNFEGDKLSPWPFFKGTIPIAMRDWCNGAAWLKPFIGWSHD